MPHTLVSIDTSRITDWDSFHDVFEEAFGLPGFYGRNMNAWVDCLSSLDAPDEGMSSVHAPPDGIVVIQLEDAKAFARRCPEQYAAIMECSAFVNWRRLERGQAPVLSLSFYE